MRIGPFARVLLILVVALTAVSLYATEQAFYYRGLYQGNPRVKVEVQRQNKPVYSKFDLDRSQAYTCTTQEIVDHVGMVCDSPDGYISISCTVATGDTNPTRYFC